MSRKSDELIQKYLNHTCTPEERAIVESWYNFEAGTAEMKDESVDYEELELDIWKSLNKFNKPTRQINFPLIAAVAACIVFCLLYYYSDRTSTVPKASSLSAKTLLPGSNKAELILEDGTVLSLTDEKAGLLTHQNGVAVNNLGSGRLSYDASQSEIFGNAAYNTLRTPRGGQYEVDLPDGTRVWLNSGSSLKFPTVFNRAERVVEIVGEGYFEVAINKQKPFKVLSQGQTIEVLGTHFNVNAYPDELTTTTTLMEGSVKVKTLKETLVIKPGQQTIFHNDSHEIRIATVDIQEAIAWKEGYFQFNDEDIKSIMRKLSRWYDIEVIYSNNFVNQRFSGSVSRFDEAAKVLKLLEYTGTVHFKIQGRRVTVIP